ncbi:MAG TPA: polymer-forming cytoskeletal protein [Pseudomonadales bacterium]|nr:polymer-forming cytoskeletal protein [Pseudomonadales bacterium]
MFGEKDKQGRSEPAARETAAPGKGATLIANNTRIEGDVHFSDQLLVNGEIHGSVFADQDSDAGLTISSKGEVVGEIRVPNVVVNGNVRGDIHASKHVELAAEARVEGDVYYHLIEMVVGARVDGSLVYTPPGDGKSANTGVPAKEAPAQEAPRPAAAPAPNPTAAVGKAQG